MVHKATSDTRATDRVFVCLNCGYDLTGLLSARCPECGAKADKDLLAELTDAELRAVTHRIGNAAVALVSLGILVGLFPLYILFLPMVLVPIGVLLVAVSQLYAGLTRRYSVRGRRVYRCAAPYLRGAYDRSQARVVVAGMFAILVAVLGFGFVYR